MHQDPVYPMSTFVARTVRFYENGTNLDTLARPIPEPAVEIARRDGGT